MGWKPWRGVSRGLSYIWHPKRSFIYGEEHSIGHGLSSGGQKVRLGINYIVYGTNKLVGRGDKTTIGRQEAEKERRDAAVEEAKATQAAQAAAAAGEQSSMSAYAAELARLRRKRGFASTLLSREGTLG